ncbi:hypothetical protein L861_05810 [Litchfieldella anticariensis FP35 = DSM 16096]|uniref:Uncharacterized protein n=1 Tax=Litchfieldella anticariensis (strain DSM 16096 / CECT 5854 / CIP 108499 / LMG 22089 / FP35) TaxID=1121939 RepID=S2KG83_LITA3|nr:hypothetical protein [Halomonas anticariensis]EPC00915.1 hypothetical protein L861_05810 [Halomonas anticariensis FP35 = DSM 16096]
MRISRTRQTQPKSRKPENIHSDKDIEGILILLIYSGRHEKAEPLFAEARRLLPGVNEDQLNRVAHRFASQLKANGIAW